MRAFVVDDHELVRIGLRMLLTKTGQFKEIRGFSTLTEVLAEGPPPPELVLLDLSLPDATGLESLLAVRRHVPEARVLVVAGSDELDVIDQAFSHGAAGFVPKNSSGETLAAAISLVLQGQAYVPVHVLPSFRSSVGLERGRATSTTDIRLTARQTDVLRGVVRGLQNKDIAVALAMSPATVRAHVSAILLALGVENRTQAAMHPFARALVDMSTE